jgi:peptidylprolyl isomerase
MIRSLSVFLLVLVLTAEVRTQKLSPDEREILMLQDQRSLGDGKLVSYLNHSNPTLRYRAALALANLQDSSTVWPLLPALSDSVAEVRAATAFALGQIGSATAETALLTRLNHESNPAVLFRLFEAIGRCGTNAGLDALVEYDASEENTAVHRGILLGVARFALRGIKDERSVWYSFDQTTSPDAGVRWMALYALWRTAPARVIDVEIAKREEALKRLASDPDPDVRLNLAVLMGRSSGSYAADILAALDEYERGANSWRVQVALVRAFATHVSRDPDLFPLLVHYLTIPNDHVTIAALQSLATLPKQLVVEAEEYADVEQRILAIGRDASRADAVRGEAFVSLGRYASATVPRQLLDDPKAGIRLKTKIIEALSLDPSAENFSVLLRHLNHQNVRLSMAAWDFVRRFVSPAQVAQFEAADPKLDNVRGTLIARMKESLARNDIAITTLVAMAAADTGAVSLFWDTAYRQHIVDELTGALQRLRSPDDTEAMQAVLEALGIIGNEGVVSLVERFLEDGDRTVAQAAAVALARLTGNDYSAKIPRATKPMYADYDWEKLESLLAGAHLALRTSHGDVRMQLLPDHAPFTVLNIVKLAEQGFYDGLTFHRVVPNFVVQGGDPRGDGWGGPGYAIRSEYSLVNYERGMVGIASAGKDTEGCQFFIVHSPQPHLDGRYTIFARVVEGMDVVDRIQMGDTILSMRVVR